MRERLKGPEAARCSIPVADVDINGGPAGPRADWQWVICAGASGAGPSAWVDESAHRGRLRAAQVVREMQKAHVQDLDHSFAAAFRGLLVARRDPGCSLL